MISTFIIVFLVFSFLGWVWESIYCTVKEHKWANRGFLYGPICPIYGFGGIVGLAIYNFVAEGMIPVIPLWLVFFIGFAVSMVLEYPTSWFLEKVFHARWWDYSNLPMNINGRTSVPTSLAFGVASIVIMEVAIPETLGIISFFPEWLSELIAFVFIAVFSADITLTVSALTDFQKHVSSVDEAFQNYMTEAVYQLINTRHKFYSKTIKRIAVFKLPRGKERFAELIKNGNHSDANQSENNPSGLN